MVILTQKVDFLLMVKDYLVLEIHFIYKMNVAWEHC